MKQILLLTKDGAVYVNNGDIFTNTPIATSVTHIKYLP